MKIMNKNIYYSMTLAAVLAVSCSSNEDFSDKKVNNEENLVTVTLEASLPSTRTALEDGGKGIAQKWGATDRIKVYNSVKKDHSIFKKKGTEVNAVAKFEGTLSAPAAGDQLYAFYPADLQTTGATAMVDYSSQGNGSLTDVQNRAVMYAAAKNSDWGSSSQVQFTNATSILRLKLTFPQDVTVSRIVVSANKLISKENLTLSGTGTAAWESPVYGSMTVNTKNISTASKALTAYMTAIPQKGLKEVNILAVTTDNRYFEKTLAATNVDFNAGQAHTLTATLSASEIINYTSDVVAEAPADPDKDGIYEITTAGQLKWLQTSENLANYVTKGKVYKLMKNVNLNGVNWTSIGDNTNSFNGSFDGNGRTISGFHQEITSTMGGPSGLFGIVSSEVPCNIHDFVLKGTSINTALQEDNVTAGGILGFGMNNVHVYNCTVNMDNFTSTDAQTSIIWGGIAGMMSTRCSIENCESNITTITTSGLGAMIGGIVGSASPTEGVECKVIGCRSNIGEIVVSNTNEPYKCKVGGIAGQVNGCIMAFCLSNCTRISNGYTGFTDNEDHDYGVGGIFGYTYSGDNVVSGCIGNNGKLQGNNGYTGGLAGYAFSSVNPIIKSSAITNSYFVKAAANADLPSVVLSGKTPLGDNRGSVESVSLLNGEATLSILNKDSEIYGYHYVTNSNGGLPLIVKN